MPLSNIKKRIKRNISKNLGLMGVAGSGGGGKGGKSSGRGEAFLRPPQAADIKQTVAVAGALDLLCEGPIGGSVNPRGIYTNGKTTLQSVYLNNVPVLELSENLSTEKDFIQNNFVLHYSHSGVTFDMLDTGRYDIQFYCEDDFLKYFVEDVNINRDLVPLGELAKTIFCVNGRPSSTLLSSAEIFPETYTRRIWYQYRSPAFMNTTHDINSQCQYVAVSDGSSYTRSYAIRRGFSINSHAEAIMDGLDAQSRNSNINFVFNSVFLQQVDQRTISGAQYQHSKYNISGGGLTEPADLETCLANYTGNASGLTCSIFDTKQLFDRSLYDFGDFNAYCPNVPAMLISRQKPNDLFRYGGAVDPLRASQDPEGYLGYGDRTSPYSAYPYYTTHHYGGTKELYSSYASRLFGYNSNPSKVIPFENCPIDYSDIRGTPYNSARDNFRLWWEHQGLTGIPIRGTGTDITGSPYYFGVVRPDFHFPRISGNKLRFYDPNSQALGGASSRETIPLRVENFEEDFLNGYYLRSGGHIFKHQAGSYAGRVDETNIYSDRKIRNQTNATNPYERNTKFVNRLDFAAYMETGITPNNTTGWILKYSGTPYYYFDNCIQKKFNYDGEEGYDLYSPQQFLRKRWTGSLEFTDSTALSLTGSPEFTQFQNNNAEDFSGGWISNNGYTPGNIVSILGTGYGDWKIPYPYRPWPLTKSIVGGTYNGEAGYVHAAFKVNASEDGLYVLHFDDNSGLSSDSKVTTFTPYYGDSQHWSIMKWYPYNTNDIRPRILQTGYLNDFLTMEAYVSGKVVPILGDATVKCVYNQNPIYYNGSKNYSSIQANEFSYHNENLSPFFQTAYQNINPKRYLQFQDINVWQQHLEVQQATPSYRSQQTIRQANFTNLRNKRERLLSSTVCPKIIKNGQFCTNSNGDVCLPTKSFAERDTETIWNTIYNYWAQDYYGMDISELRNLVSGAIDSEIFDIVSRNELRNSDNFNFGLRSVYEHTYVHDMFEQKIDGIVDCSIAGEMATRDLYELSQTSYNYNDVYAEFRNGEEVQTKIQSFSESKTENKVVSDLFGPFKSGGDAQEGNGSTDIRTYDIYGYSSNPYFPIKVIGTETVNYSDWTNELPVDEDEINYKYIVDRDEVVKVECIIEIAALQDVDHNSNSILPSFINFEIEVGFDGLEKTNTYPRRIDGMVDPSSPFITNLLTVDLPKYSEIKANYPDKSLSYLKRNHKRYVLVRKTTYETESILISRQARTRAFNEIIDSNFTYPNSALAAVYFDSKSFTDPPKRTYDLRLKKCKIPSNYYPIHSNGLDKRFLQKESDTKELIYSGDWDGSFKEDWTDNPAWVLYDILTNNSYGLGDYQDDIEDIDIFKLYQIGRYCDAVDSSGYFSGLSTNAGGLEPRYSCNMLFEESFNGFDFVNAISNMFHGVAYWKNGSINFFADKPEDVSATFDNSNVFDGVFSYSDMNKNNRFNFVEIEYKDKTDDFKTKVEYVEDEEDIRKKGIIKYKEGARGITSRSQARRYAKHILYSNKLETEGVQFQASQQSIIVEPGDIIQINDELKSFQRDSARLLEVDTLNNSIKIENTINTGAIATGEGVYISTPTGQTSLNDLYTGINFHDLSITDSVLSGYEAPQIINVDITGINQGTNHIELLLNENHEDIYRLGQAKLGQMCNVRITGAPENLYRVMSIIPNENNLYEIVAKEYNPVKYKIIEEGEGLENNEYYNLPHIGLPANIINRPPEPQGFSFSTGENNMYSINLSGTITGEVGGIEEKYRVSVTKPNGMYFFQEFEKDSTLSPPETYFEFKNLIGAGEYKIEVTSMLNPESSKTLEKTFEKPPRQLVYENPFLNSVKINGENYNEVSNISSIENFGKDILIDLNYVNNYGLPYENKNHIKMNLLQGSTGHSFDIPELPVSITKDERDQIFGSAERTFTIQSYLEDSNGNIYPSPEIIINHSAPKINSVQILNNNYNFRLNIETENFKNLEKISIYSGANQDFEISPESFLVTKPFHPQLNNEVEFGHQTTGKVCYKLIPYDCFGSGVLYTGFSGQINFPEPEVSDSYSEIIYNTLFLNNSQNISGEFVFSQIFNVPQKDLVLKIGGTPNEDDCVVDLFLGQFSGRFMIPFNNNSYSNNIYFCSNPFAKNTENLLKFSSDLVDDNSVSGKLVSGDLSNLDLEIKA